MDATHESTAAADVTKGLSRNIPISFGVDDVVRSPNNSTDDMSIAIHAGPLIRNTYIISSEAQTLFCPDH